jgi:hypothetical protein
MHVCGILLAAYVGIVFYTAEIYEGFGLGTATFFFKVSTEVL